MTKQTTLFFAITLMIVSIISGCSLKQSQKSKQAQDDNQKQGQENISTSSMKEDETLSTTTTETTTEDDVQPEIITSNIDTSNWKTYRSDEYGFEVKYPGDWFVRENNSNPELMASVYFKTDNSNMNDYGISVYVSNMPSQGLDCQGIIDKYNNSNVQRFEYGEIVIDKKRITQLKGWNRDFWTYFEDVDKYYNVTFLPAGEIDKSVYDTFLLNFKILE